MALCVRQRARQRLLLPHMPTVNYMWKHLKLISEATESGHHALVIMDDAGWHQQELTEDFDKLSILKLPPYSPQLNPIEQVWQ